VIAKIISVLIFWRIRTFSALFNFKKLSCARARVRDRTLIVPERLEEIFPFPVLGVYPSYMNNWNVGALHNGFRRQHCSFLQHGS
jgi:hypothetical protein